jgi:hypothetical protein
MSGKQEERERRAVHNSLLFRSVNEQIVGLTGSLSADLSDINLVCECWSPSCTGTIRCRLEEFELVHRTGDMFLVLPGHEDLLVEDVVDASNGYTVVRKRDLADRVVEQAQAG